MRKFILLHFLLIGLCCSARTKGEKVVQQLLNDGQWITAGSPQRGQSLPVFRQSFIIGKKPKNAVLQATALGIYDVTINGQRVGRHELKPGWTDYRKEVTFQTFDITSLLHRGNNEITVQLSRGWWGGGISRGVYGKQPPLTLKARIVADGRCITATDTTWQYSLTGPLLEGDIYNGETYDARRTPADWQATTVVDSLPMAVVPFEGPEVRTRPERLWRHPQSITLYHDTIGTGTTFGQIGVE